MPSFGFGTICLYSSSINSSSDSMICFKCKYEWISRKPNPKACPKCKSRLDNRVLESAEGVL